MFSARHATVLVSIARLSIAALAAGFAACGGGGSQPPSAPAPTVTSVSISGIGAATTVGQAAQLSAIATFSDGTRSTVSDQVTWESSNPAVATVSSTGSASFIAVGDVDIKATYRGVNSTMHVTVSARAVARYQLSGIVTDSGNGQPLSGVQVMVLDGPNNGRSTQTDGSGSYAIADLQEGQFTVGFSRSGYPTASRQVTLSANARLDVGLSPAPTDVSGFYGTFNVRLTVSHQNCGAFPVTPDPTGQIALGGNPTGSPFTATMMERGTSRSFAGRMNADGTFSASGMGVIPGFASFRLSVESWVPAHDYSGSIQGRVSGRNLSGAELLTYGAPCPGGVIQIEFTGSR